MVHYLLPAKISQYIDQLIGRTWLLPRILDWYKNSNDRLLLITGDPGTGKSMIAAWLAGAGPRHEDPAPDVDLPKQLLFNDMPPSQQLDFLRSQKGAVHFCQAEGGSVQPSALAKSLADQLTRTVPGYNEALQSFLSDRVVFNVDQTVTTVESGGAVTGVSIDRLNIQDLDDQTRFNRTVREPIINLYNRGYAEKLLIIVDSLDEALSYDGEPNIPTLLAQLADLPDQVRVRVLATTRPDPRILRKFVQVPTLDLVDDAPADAEDVRSYAYGRLPASLGEQRRSDLAQKIAEASQGIFLYAHLVIEDLLQDLEDGNQADEIDFPSGLSGFYSNFLRRELGKESWEWENAYQPILGIISIAQDEGLHQEQLKRITGRNVQEILVTCRQYLDGEFPEGPFRVFHRSFAEFLLESKENQYFRVPAANMHALITDYYCPDGSKWACSKWDDYAERSITVHLEGASQLKDERARHSQVRRLVRLVGDPIFQNRFRRKINDELRMKHIILSAIRAASGDTHEEAPDLLLRSVRLLQTHRHEWLLPRPIFARAEDGELYEAIDQLLAFPMEAQWQRAAALVLSWLAAEKVPDKAAQIVKRSESRPERSVVETKLANRLRSVLENSVIELDDLPEPPSREHVAQLLQRLRLESTEQELTDSPHALDGPLDDSCSVPVSLARQDGPAMVAYARAHREEGLQIVQQYLDLRGADPYPYYRNESLWELIDAILRHPDPDWTIRALKALFVTAFNIEGMAYEEALELVLLGLQARAGQNEARQMLEKRRQAALKRAQTLQEDRSDTWSVHKRRFSALAVAFNLLSDRQETAKELLLKAMDLPRGFAGFAYSAWLNLAENLQVCGMTADQYIDDALEKALVTAQNIQDSVFCARATAQVNAMKKRWWPVPDNLDLKDIVGKLNQRAVTKEITSLHCIGENFPKRVNDSYKGPLQPDLLHGNTLCQLSKAFDLPLADFMAANAGQGWGPDTPITERTPVNVPDPAFRPLLAARLSAEVTAANWLYPFEKRALVQPLILAAVHQRTIVDTILSRLFLIADVDSQALLERLMPLARQVYAQLPDMTGGE